MSDRAAWKVPQCVAIVSGFPKLNPFRCEVCWHVNLWHYRSSNPSPNSRIAVAGVWSNLEINGDLSRSSPNRTCGSERASGYVGRDGNGDQ